MDEKPVTNPEAAAAEKVDEAQPAPADNAPPENPVRDAAHARFNPLLQHSLRAQTLNRR